MDRLAGLISRGNVKRAALTPTDAATLTVDPAALLSRPKRAILEAATELLGMIGGADVPFMLKPLVGMLSGAQPMLVSSVAAMEETEVRRILAVIGARVDDALTEEPAVIDAADPDGQ